jgi:hypothetical protein
MMPTAFTTHPKKQPYTHATKQSALRPSRWYDVYPNLKLGLHLLYLAPSATQQRLSVKLVVLVADVLNLTQTETLALAQDPKLLPVRQTRWYDRVPHLTLALALLKQMPPAGVRQVSRYWLQQFGEALALPYEAVAQPVALS